MHLTLGRGDPTTHRKGNFGERKVIPLLVLKTKDRKPNETKLTQIFEFHV